LLASWPKKISLNSSESFTHIQCECHKCRHFVEYPFKLIRDRRPSLLPSAMTIAELGKKIPCGLSGSRDVACEPWRQPDIIGLSGA
jgi:hypothetical protein